MHVNRTKSLPVKKHTCFIFISKKITCKFLDPSEIKIAWSKRKEKWESNRSGVRVCGQRERERERDGGVPSRIAVAFRPDGVCLIGCIGRYYRLRFLLCIPTHALIQLHRTTPLPAASAWSVMLAIVFPSFISLHRNGIFFLDWFTLCFLSYFDSTQIKNSPLPLSWFSSS